MQSSPVSKTMRGVVEAIAANPGATLDVLSSVLRVPAGRKAINEFCWRAERRGMVISDHAQGEVRYTVTPNWSFIAAGVDPCDHNDGTQGDPGVPLVLMARMTQPNSVFALGARP